MIFNYRVNFGGDEIDYKSDFKSCRQYFPVLQKLYAIMQRWSVQYSWHFFEPFVEFTWVLEEDYTVDQGEEIFAEVLNLLHAEGLEPTLEHRPTDGVVVDWYCKNPEEQVFGYKTYAASAKIAMLFWEYREALEKGCGERNQFMRRPHVLANQIGMNYNEEGKALTDRATFCRLAWECDGGQEEVVRRYEEETGKSYL